MDMSTVFFILCNINLHIYHFALPQISKLVLDDYFSSSDFLASVDAGAAYDSAVTTPTTPSVQIPAAHQLNTSSSFADSGIGLNFMGQSQSGRSLGSSSASRKSGNNNNNNRGADVDDDVFIVENGSSSRIPLFLCLFNNLNVFSTKQMNQ